MDWVSESNQIPNTYLLLHNEICSANHWMGPPLAVKDNSHRMVQSSWDHSLLLCHFILRAVDVAETNSNGHENRIEEFASPVLSCGFRRTWDLLNNEGDNYSSTSWRLQTWRSSTRSLILVSVAQKKLTHQRKLGDFICWVYFLIVHLMAPCSWNNERSVWSMMSILSGGIKLNQDSVKTSIERWSRRRHLTRLLAKIYGTLARAPVKEVALIFFDHIK